MLFGTQKINSKGHLEIGGCDTVELAEKFGTPLYVMDEAHLRQNCQAYLNSFRTRYPNTEIAFAGKAFLPMAMCRIVDQEGLYLDVASGGELYTALKAGFPPERILLHGNCKTADELQMALDNGVGRIVVDNLTELEKLNTLAVERKQKAQILFRVTPGVDPHTHRLISTGQEDTKFGFNIKSGAAMDAVRKALDYPGIELRGIHCHVGSQLLDTEAHTAAIDVMVEFAKEILDETGFLIEDIDTGGGLGIRYVEGQNPPTIDQFANAVVSALKRSLDKHCFPKPRLIQEPGRSIVGTAGITLYHVGAVKKVPIPQKPGYKTYIIVDGGMSDNPRPLLYGALYEAIIANRANEPATQIATISGKHCETDTLIPEARIAETQPGDVLAVFCTGAYTFDMASNYNRFCRPAVVLVLDGQADVIVERESLEDLIRREIIPPRLR
ncbi:MAG: diaminopimelate decarboxylase [Armatimonadetes bacterium]|nr:diaminopimelate decarboxylase [Armatimonadota bacterium]